MLIIVIIVGAIIGSFLSVCIYRIPLSKAVGLNNDEHDESSITTEVAPDADLSITSPPRSFCPKCKQQLLWWHNIPIIGWIILRGRCHFCKERISFRYPFVEILTAGAAALSFIQFGTTFTALFAFLITAALITISFIDYDYYIIPNVISLPGTAIGLVVIAINQFTHFLSPPFAPDIYSSLLGLASGAGFLWIVSELYLWIRKHEGLGMGDIKLLALVGAFFGMHGALFTIFIGSLLGSVLGIVILLFTRKGMSHPLPFGPYLAAGAVLFIFIRQAATAVPLFPVGLN